VASFYCGIISESSGTAGSIYIQPHFLLVLIDDNGPDIVRSVNAQLKFMPPVSIVDHFEKSNH